MSKRFTLIFFLLLGVSFSQNSFATPTINAVFLNPGSENAAFFGPMTQFMQKAAKNLGINLEVVYADFNRFTMLKKGQEILARNQLPNYLVLINEWNVCPSLMEQADTLGVKVLLFNEGLTEKDRNKFTRGATTLDNWIGEVTPDDFQAGWLLGKTLIDQAIEKKLYDTDDKIHLIGIAGSRATRSAILREKGLKLAVSSYQNVILHQIVPGHWEEERARDITSGLLRRYPQTSVIWAASDVMAKGATQAVKESDVSSHQNIIIGGIDWAPFVFDTLAKDHITASVGGHIFDGGWAMVMIHDHANNKYSGFQTEKTKFSLATVDNKTQVKDLLDSAKWDDYNFMKYCKTHNPEKEKYGFGVELLYTTKPTP